MPPQISTVYPPEIWAMESLMILENSHVAANLVHRNFEDEVAQFGDVINTRKPTKFTVNDMNHTLTATLTPQEAQATLVSITLDRHKEVSWRLTDRDMATSIKNLIDEFMEPAISPIAEQIDSDILSSTDGLTASGFGTTAGTSTQLVFGDFSQVRQTLRGKQVPLRGVGGQPTVSIVLGTEHEGEILRVTEFVQANTFGNNPPALQTGYLGQVFGMNVFADQTVPSSTSTGAKNSPAFHRNALAYVSRPLEQPPADLGVRSAVVSRDGTGLRVIMSYDHLRLGWLISVDILYGIQILDNQLGTVLNS